MAVKLAKKTASHVHITVCISPYLHQQEKLYILVVVKPSIEMKPKLRLNLCRFPCSAISASSCRVRPLTLRLLGSSSSWVDCGLFVKVMLGIS